MSERVQRLEIANYNLVLQTIRLKSECRRMESIILSLKQDIYKMSRELNDMTNTIFDLRDEIENLERRHDDKDMIVQCVVCMQNYVNVLMRPCNHLCLCESCLAKMEMKSLSLKCPVCRTPCTECIHPVYLN
jgi:predicted RNase H-like nuclease (RuvC/YqgF family)